MSFFHLFQKSTPIVRVLGNITLLALVIVASIQFTHFLYVGDKSHFIRLIGTPRILNIETLEPQHVFHPADSLALEYTFEKREIGCYAEYQIIIIGPVDIQLPTRKSQFIGKRGTIATLRARVLVNLPHNIPVGTYRVELTVFPVCDGVPRDAFGITNPIPTFQVL